MTKCCCLSRLACWCCYNPVEQQLIYHSRTQHCFFFNSTSHHSSLLPRGVQCLPFFSCPFIQGCKRFLNSLGSCHLGDPNFLLFVFHLSHSSFLLYYHNCTLFHQLLQCLTVWTSLVLYVHVHDISMRYLVCQDSSMVVLCFFLLDLSE